MQTVKTTCIRIFERRLIIYMGAGCGPVSVGKELVTGTGKVKATLPQKLRFF